MGYNLCITRARSSLDHSDHPIPEGEWQAVVRSDTSLRISQEDYFERKAGDGTIERMQLVIWQEHPDRIPFWYEEGAVFTKNPDEKTIEKMVQLATKLEARVLGEEDEEYLPGGKTITQQVDKAVLAQRQRNAPIVAKGLAILAMVSILPQGLADMFVRVQSRSPGAQNAFSKILLATQMLSIVFAWLAFLMAIWISIGSVIPRRSKLMMWIWIVLSIIVVCYLNPFLRL
jgi:hypothetical protein